MSSNLQALEKLKQSAKRQTEELMNFNQEILQENWNKLSKDLMNTTNKKLELIERSFNNTMQQMQEQNKSRYTLKQMIATSTSIALIFLFLGVILADYTPKMSERIAWTVPKEMRYITKDGTRYIGSKDKETFIKLEK